MSECPSKAPYVPRNTPKPPNPTQDDYVQFKCSKAFKERLRAYAHENGQSMGSLIRSTLIKAMDSHSS